MSLQKLDWRGPSCMGLLNIVKTIQFFVWFNMSNKLSLICQINCFKMMLYCSPLMHHHTHTHTHTHTCAREEINDAARIQGAKDTGSDLCLRECIVWGQEEGSEAGLGWLWLTCVWPWAIYLTSTMYLCFLIWKYENNNIYHLGMLEGLNDFF